MFEKLKHEWKTFAFGVVTTLIGLYDSIAAYGYDYTPIIPEQYRPYVVPAIGLGFLLLRQYRDKNV